MRQSQILFFVLFLATVSCGKKEASRGDNNLATSKQELVETGGATETANSILVPMKLISSAFKIDNETDSVITIEPCTPYYKEWISNKRMEIPCLCYNGDILDCPKLDVYITNNTDQTISVSSLEFMVKESKIDDLPYIDISDNCTSPPNCLSLRNESWFNWGTMYLDYSILRKGEKFNGKYKGQKTIPYFEDVLDVDFTQDLAKMGLNINYLKERDYFHLDPEEFTPNEMLKVFHPFEVDEEGFGIFKIYGRIRFSKSKFTKEFYGYLDITPFGEGAANEESDKFDVKLEYDKKNYSISYPYNTVLRPGDNERVKLKLNCPRSSNHRFYISINNDNGLVMRTKDIQMHFINGRFSNLNLIIRD